MNTVKEICQFIGENLSVEQPLCVETGSTYVTHKDNLVHTTTNNIYKHICEPHKGTLLSFDIDPEHQTAAATLIPEGHKFAWKDWNGREEGGSVVFVEGDSAERLSDFVAEINVVNNLIFPSPKIRISVLCLDSKEFDVDHMVAEYEAVAPILADKHYVLVDDIHNPNSVKWVKMVPKLKELGYEWVEIPTPTGLFFASKGLPLPEVA